jgi:hypothetical protein
MLGTRRFFFQSSVIGLPVVDRRSDRPYCMGHAWAMHGHHADIPSCDAVEDGAWKLVINPAPGKNGHCGHIANLLDHRCR